MPSVLKAKETIDSMAEISETEAQNTEEVHYEEVAEYRIGEGPPPLGLVVAFALIFLWALFSWIPFFGY